MTTTQNVQHRSEPARLQYRFHFLIYIVILSLQMLASGFYLVVNNIDTKENLRLFIISFVCQFVFYIAMSAMPGIDMYLIIPVMFLYGFSLPIVHYVNPQDLTVHVISFVLGAVGFVFSFFASSDEMRMRKFHRVLYFAGLVLVLSALILGKTDRYGGHSWIYIGTLSLQPSELFKPVVVVLLAVHLSKQLHMAKQLPFILYLIVCLGIIVIGLNDTGMALILTAAIVITFVLSGMKKRYLLLILCAVAIFIPILLTVKPHIADRLSIVIKGPFSDYYGAGYQISQGLMMMINGGLFGSGATDAMGYLFAASSDFSFVSLCSYYGWIFAVAVLAAFALIGLRSFLSAIRMHSRYRAILCIGAGSMLVFQALWHITGLLGLLPLSGITLPFASAGGTSMITSFILLGLIQGASYHDSRTLSTARRELEENN